MRDDPGMRRTVLTVSGLLVLALGVRALGLDWGLPQVYEEAYPFKRAWPMWGWEPGTSFDLNPHFFNYPTLYFYVQFIGQGLLFVLMRLFGGVESLLDYRVLYAVDKSAFYLMGRSITMLFGVATVLSVYRLGVQVRGFTVGIVAAFLVAVNHVHITKSQVIEVDVPLTFFLVTCIYYCVRILDDPRPRNYLLAGVFAGLATSTKYSGMLLPACILAAHGVVVWGMLRRATPRPLAVADAGKPRKGHTARRRRTTRVVARSGKPSVTSLLRTFLLSRSLLGAGIASIAALLLTSPYIALDYEHFWTAFRYERFHMAGGHFGLDDSSTILFYARVLTDSLLGWPLALVSLAALVYLMFVRRYAWAWVVSLFPLVYLTLISSLTMRAERYILPLMPLAGILAAAFASEMLERARAPLARRSGLVLASVAVVLALPSITSFALDRSRLRPDTRTLAREWIEQNVPSGAYVASEAYGPEPLSAIELAGLSLDVRQRLTEQKSEVPVYALAPIPMHQVVPELMGMFYDMALYEDLVDYLVVSSSVSSRYRKDPKRFWKQIEFYAELERSWVLVQQFGPEDGVGPRLRIYKNPKQSVPFAQRETVEPVTPRTAGTPEVSRVHIGAFYRRQALNLEWYGFFPAALASYSVALVNPMEVANYTRDVTLGIVRCYERLGEYEQALQVVEAARASAANDADMRFWADLGARLEAAH